MTIICVRLRIGLFGGVLCYTIRNFIHTGLAEEDCLFPNGKLMERLVQDETKLFQWIQNCDLSNVCIGLREDGTRGLFVTKPVAKNKMIFEIPHFYVLSHKVKYSKFESITGFGT